MRYNPVVPATVPPIVPATSAQVYQGRLRSNPTMLTAPDAVLSIVTHAFPSVGQGGALLPAYFTLTRLIGDSFSTLSVVLVVPFVCLPRELIAAARDYDRELATTVYEACEWAAQHRPSMFRTKSSGPSR